jgi:hypothetical protein
VLPKINTEFFSVANTSDPDAGFRDAPPNEWREITGAPSGATVLRIRALNGAALVAVKPYEVGDMQDFRRWLVDLGRAGLHADSVAEFDALPMEYQLTLGLAVREVSSPTPDPTTAPASK